MPNHQVKFWVADLEEITSGRVYCYSPGLELQLRDAIGGIEDQDDIPPGAVIDLNIRCGFAALWWLDFRKRYFPHEIYGNEIYWVTRKSKNIPVWVAIRNGVPLIDRMLHITKEDQRIIASHFAVGTIWSFYAGPGLELTEWLRDRYPLFTADHDPDEWETERRWNQWGWDSVYSTDIETDSEWTEEEADVWCDDVWECESDWSASVPEPGDRVYDVRFKDDASFGEDFVPLDRVYTDEEIMRMVVDFNFMQRRWEETYAHSEDWDESWYTSLQDDLYDDRDPVYPDELLDRLADADWDGDGGFADIPEVCASDQNSENVVNGATTEIVNSWSLKRTAFGVFAFHFLCACLFLSMAIAFFPSGMIACCLAGPAIQFEVSTGLRNQFTGLSHYWFGDLYGRSGLQTEDFVCSLETGDKRRLCDEGHKVARSFHGRGWNVTFQEYAVREILGNGDECKCEPVAAIETGIENLFNRVHAFAEGFGLFTTLSMVCSSAFGMLKGAFVAVTSYKRIKNLGIALCSAAFEFYAWVLQKVFVGGIKLWRWISHHEVRTAGAVSVAVVASACVARLVSYGADFSVLGVGFCAGDDELQFPRGQKISLRYLPCATNLRGAATAVPERMVAFWTKIDGCLVPIGAGCAVAGGVLVCKHQARGERSMEELHAAGFPILIGRAELRVSNADALKPFTFSEVVGPTRSKPAHEISRDFAFIKTEIPSRLGIRFDENLLAFILIRLNPPWKKQGNPPLQNRAAGATPRPPRSPPHPPRSSPKPKARPESCRKREREEPRADNPPEELETVEVEDENQPMAVEDALAIWQALLEMEHGGEFNPDAPTLPPHIADNIVETLVDKPEAEHNLMADVLPLFLGRIHADLARALERARQLRATLTSSGDFPDPSRARGSDDPPETFQDEEDDNCLLMQATLHQSVKAMASNEDLLLSKLHRSLQALEPAQASSRALRLASLLADHDGHLAVDRSLLEAFLVATNEDTPPLPGGDNLLIEHAWCATWWRRLRGLPEVDAEEVDNHLATLDENTDQPGTSDRDAEEAHQAAQEAMYLRGLEDAYEHHMEALKSEQCQAADDRAIRDAMGFSQARPKKRLCLGLCITNGAMTKAFDFEIDEAHPVQIHVVAESKEWPGQWYHKGQPVAETEVPQTAKDQLAHTTSASSSRDRPRQDAHVKRYDITRPTTRNLYDRWKQGELSDQTIVSIGGIGLLTYYRGLADVPDEVWDELAARDTLTLEPPPAQTDPPASTAPPPTVAEDSQAPQTGEAEVTHIPGPDSEPTQAYPEDYQGDGTDPRCKMSAVVTEVDFEAELAIILGRPVRDATPEAALEAVLGVTAANDISARRWQGKKGGGQWSRSKSFDTFCPLGPTLLPVMGPGLRL
ncbi:fahd2 [Symbiodinium microadriaticum]|nr:fahd2 [Symbiodinium microadriaticum]